MVPENHTYSRKIDDIESLQGSQYVSDKIEEFNSKNIQYEATKGKCDKILRNLITLSDQKMNLRRHPKLLWHYRLGDRSKIYLKKASMFLPELKMLNLDSMGECPICIRAKAIKKASLTTRFRYAVPLNLVHSDVIGSLSHVLLSMEINLCSYILR